MPPIPRQTQRDHSGGVQNRTVTPLMLPNQVLHALNAEFDTKLGAVTGRKAALKSSVVVAGQQVKNLFVYKSGAARQCFAVSNDGVDSTDVYLSGADNFAGAWASAKALGLNAEVFFEDFVKKLFAFNGLTPVVWDGTSWVAVTGAPAGGKFPVVYNQRLYAIAEDGFLWYSDVVNALGTDFSSTTWTSRGINPFDGQLVKMAKRVRGRIMIWKNESIYRFDGTNEPEANINVGTHSGKSVVVFGDAYFHSPVGIQRIGASEPVLISRAVQKYIDGMDKTNWDKVAGGRDLQNVYHWIGDVTINDPLEFDYNVTYSNVVLVHNVYSQNWTVFSGWDARVWYFDEKTGETYFGTSTGQIWKINTGYSESDGTTVTEIDFQLVFTPDDFGFPERYKEVGKVIVIGKYNSFVYAGADFADMMNNERTQMDKNIGLINEGITCKKLWVGVFEKYSDVPPRIEDLITDEINLLEDSN